MTHTPGPWKKDGLKVIAGTRGTICVCPVVSLGGTFDVEANACLIAAAPEMLEALKDSRDLILTLWMNIDENTVEKRTLGKAFDIASRAIAKAEAE